MSKRRTSKYLQLEAESGSEEYESSEESEDLDNIVRELPKSKVKSMSQFTEELEQRYKQETEHEKKHEELSGDNYMEDLVEEEQDVLEAPSQTLLLPTVTSPLLFLVKCKIGKEKDIVLKLYENIKGNEINTIIYKEGLKGYIYIESFSKQKVEELLYTVNNVSRRKFSVVPLKEMIEAISYKKNIIVGEFARIKTGKYKGDLVQILENYEDVVKVKLIPRIDNIKKLFDPNEFRNEVVAKDGGFYYNRDFYKNGFLQKIMLKSNLDFDVEPSFLELEQLSLKKSFSINEPIKICKGDLKNLTGVVENINGNIAVISSNNKKYEVNLDEIEKNYTLGQEVSYKGENGIILKLTDKSVVLGMDGFTREIECLIKDLKLPVKERTIINAQESIKLRARRDPLVNRSVRIIGGEFKGLTGTVKDVVQEKCIVQLRTNLKMVKVDKRFIYHDMPQSLSVPQIRTDVAKEPTFIRENGFKTPSYKTPSFKTPSYKTPSYKTPSFKSPSYKTPTGEASSRFSNTYLNEDAGVEWLVKSPYEGGEIKVNDKYYILSDVSGGSFKTKTGEIFFPYEVAYCTPSIYDRVVILEGQNKGVEGTLTLIQGNDGKVRDKEDKTYNVNLNNLTRKAE